MTWSDLGLALLLLVILALIVWLIRQWLRRPYQLAPVAYGLDFSWGRPSVDALVREGVAFVCRYHSPDDTGKNLTAAEAQSYLAAGIAIVSNWQHGTHDWQGGYDAGVACALEADRQQRACGGNGDPIYFSIDSDLSDAYQYECVVAYLAGVASVIGIRRTGAYAEYDVIRRLFDDQLIAYGWQTYAWSYGQWDPRAQLRQVLNNVTFDGAQVDIDEAWSTNYGAWGHESPQEPAQPQQDGTVILNCPYDPERIDLFWVGPGLEVYHRWYTGGMQAMWSTLGSSENLHGLIYPGTLSAAWLPDASGINIVGLGLPDEEEVPEGCGQYWGCTIGRDGSKSGWGSLLNVFGAQNGWEVLR